MHHHTTTTIHHHHSCCNMECGDCNLGPQKTAAETELHADGCHSKRVGQVSTDVYVELLHSCAARNVQAMGVRCGSVVGRGMIC